MLASALPIFAAAKTLAHSNGLYASQEQASQKAAKLKCDGTHQNRGAWVPCLNEHELHRVLRRQ
jgi:hypothetical protein